MKPEEVKPLSIWALKENQRVRAHIISVDIDKSAVALSQSMGGMSPSVSKTISIDDLLTQYIFLGNPPADKI